VLGWGSAGAFQAAVLCFRAWLGRDRDRRIDIKWDDGGVQRSVTLTGPVNDIAAVNRALTDPETGLFAETDVTQLADMDSAGAGVLGDEHG
jgi:hypothetical protein